MPAEAVNAGWDEELLRIDLGDLKDRGVDLGLTGLGELELEKLLLGSTEGGDPDEAPEPPVDPIGRTGDIWTCGEDRCAH